MNLKKLLAASVLLSAFLPPVVGFNRFTAFEQTKELVFISLCTLSLILYIVCRFFYPRSFQVKWSRVKILSLLFLLILGISSIGGVEPYYSLIGRGPYFQGLVLYIFLYIFSILVTATKIPLKIWASTFYLAALLVSLSAIHDLINLYLLHSHVFTYSGRVVSTFGQPDLYAGFVLLGLSAGLFFGINRWLLVLGIPLQILAILGSGSRSGVALMGLILFGYLLLYLRKKIRVLMLIFSGVVIGVSIVISLRISSGIIWKEIYQPQDPVWLQYNAPEKRSIIWGREWEVEKKRIFLGYGLENITLAIGHRDPQGLFISRSDNYFLDLLLFSGIFGLLAWIGVAVVCFKQLKSTALRGLLLLYLIWSFFEVQSVVQLVFFWWLVGISDVDNPEYFLNTDKRWILNLPRLVRGGLNFPRKIFSP